MAEKIEVHFKAGTKILRAEVDPAKVNGVLILTNGGETEVAFAKKHKLKIKKNPPTLPSGIDVMDGNVLLTDTSSLEPGVCYWVEKELICW